MSRLALWKIERRLRQLQKRYYEEDPSQAASIAGEYFSALEKARDTLLGGAASGRAVHLGAGGHRIRAWINVDIVPPGVDLLADFRASLPFRDDSVDFIHSEDLLEHLDEASGKHLIGECHRILRPTGVMRILTPDLRALVERVYLAGETEHLEWSARHLGAPSPAAALNAHLRMNGEHRFVYDEQLLTSVLEEAGFRVRRVRFNWSPEPRLRYLDLRGFGLNLFLEAVKRGT